MINVKKKLVLFDIDGTLVTRCLIHETSFSIAIKKVFGIDVNITEIPAAGRTDKWIVIELLKRKGLQIERILPKIKKVYKEMSNYFQEKIKNDESFERISNVEILLNNLKIRGHVLGLLTGNVERIAKLKLKKVGLLKYFEDGGFGDISEKRSDLVEIAMKNIEHKLKIKFDKKDVFIIGDTPLDIECGKFSGVKTIAVSTGPFSLDELKKYNPNYLFEDFSNTDDIIKAIEK